MKMTKSLKLLSCIAAVFAFCFISIGYAAVQDELLINGSVSVEAQNKVYAVYNSTHYSLTFHGGTVPQTGDDEEIYTVSEDGYTAETPSPWSNIANNLFTVNVVGEFSAPQSMAYWFYECEQLEKVNLSGLNTSKTADFSYMFGNCYNIQSIYVDEGFSISDSAVTTNMFNGCTSLKGGNNTVFDENKTDKEYACIDGKDGKTGYLTYGYYTVKFNTKGGQIATPILFSKIATFSFPEATHQWATFKKWVAANSDNETTPLEYSPNESYTITESTPCIKEFYATWSNMGATSLKELEADIEYNNSGASAGQPIVIGGGEWTKIGEYNGQSIIKDKHLVIYDGNFVGGGGAVFWYPGSAVITIHGGYFEESYLAVFPTNLTINISGGVFEIYNDFILADGDGGTISITGGTFSIDPSAYVAQGYKAVLNDNGKWVVAVQ